MGDNCRCPAPEICLHRHLCVGCRSQGVLLCVSTWKEKQGERVLYPTPHQPGGLLIKLADPDPRGSVVSEVLSRSSVCVRVKSLPSCPTPCSPIHGILQATILEWVAISISRGLNPCLLCPLHWQAGSLQSPPHHPPKAHREAPGLRWGDSQVVQGADIVRTILRRALAAGMAGRCLGQVCMEERVRNTERKNRRGPAVMGVGVESALD